jgi:hypothetical protein
MLNNNEENEYRHRPEYTEFVGHDIYNDNDNFIAKQEILTGCANYNK